MKGLNKPVEKETHNMLRKFVQKNSLEILKGALKRPQEKTPGALKRTQEKTPGALKRTHKKRKFKKPRIYDIIYKK